MAMEVPERIDAGWLTLRSPTEDDIPAIVAGCQDPEVPRWTTVPSPYGEEDAREFLASIPIDRAAGTAYPLAIIDNATGELLGMTGAHHTNAAHATTEVGYWLAAAARGRGVATVALRALVVELRAVGFERIEAEPLCGNEPSRRVLERVGFQEEGVLRSVAAGRCGSGAPRIDVHVYSLIASDPIL
jgi:RimJ/RimL family protein N-acetyltransferase